VKRFYKQADVVPRDDEFGVALDGKPIRTPGNRPLAMPVRALAAAIAEEWQAQPLEGEIRPASMPLMRLAATGLDRVPMQRDKVIDDIARYAGSDLLCYRAQEPDDLVARQHRTWQPLLDWATERFGARLQVETGLRFHAQEPAALARYRAEVARYSTLGLAGLYVLTTSMGSLLLALATSDGHLAPEAAYEAAELDALYQVERWGEDHEAAKRRQGIRADIVNSARFLALLGPHRLQSGAALPA